MRHVRFEFAPARVRAPQALGALALAHFGAAAPGPEVLLPQEPPLAPADEAVLLLQAAAEIEHALLVEYLYAAYSLDPGAEPQRRWREVLVEIAMEEMAHLLSVQNLLLALGGPLNFDRDDQAFRPFYPFPFELQPFGRASLARYVLAEMPDPSQIPADIGFDLAAIGADAGATEAAPVNRVGLLYERLTGLVGGLDAADVHADALAFQAAPAEWGAPLLQLVIGTAATPAQAADLLAAIGAQGEGPLDAGGHPSHFRRFLRLYQEVVAHAGPAPARAVPTAPSTTNPAAEGYIGNPRARAWAELCDLRYRIVLVQLAHGLRLNGAEGAQRADRLRLRSWSLDEMHHVLAAIAAHLTALPQHDPPRLVNGVALVAAPPFELPYTLQLPVREIDRWRLHAALARSSRDLCARLTAPADRLLLAGVRAFDDERDSYARARIAALSASPPESDGTGASEQVSQR